ncbi:MAG: DUF4266 domain-containing protein, partial [Myxococcota bacterium]
QVLPAVLRDRSARRHRNDEPHHQYLADPTMAIVDDPLEARSQRKQHTAREGAAGGDAQAAGGGCGCGN